MLTLTETASTVVKSIVAQDPAVADGGLRIGTGPGGENDFAVSVVASAAPGDSLVESDGARVYLEPAASAALDEKVLDAQVGENGSVTFALMPQL